jgi:tetratricopeptide (TPR) repeat protein
MESLSLDDQRRSTAMRKLYLLAVVSLVTISLLASGDLCGQDTHSMDQVKTTLQGQLQDKIDLVQDWEKTSGFLLLLSIVAIVFGLVTAVLQIFKNRYCKIASGILAALISAVVTIDTTVYSVDHQTLRSKAAEAHILIDEIDYLFALDSPDLPSPDRAEIFRDIQAKLGQISKLAVGVWTGVSIDLIPKAYASNGVRTPEWVKRPPEDKSSLFFVGLAESTSFRKAKEFSFQNGISKAVDYLTLQFERRQEANPRPLDVDALSQYLVESVETAQTHTAYDKESKIYRYYTLLRLDRQFAEVDLWLFAAENKVEVPQEFQQVVKTPEQSYPQYYQFQIDECEEFFSVAQKALQPEQYEQFIEGRQLRMGMRYEEAIPLLVEVTQTFPDFYHGWYNLALAYDGVDNFEAAEEAYRRAIELNRQMDERDASLYTAYGALLHRQGQNEGAAVQLREALKIKPDNPKAKKILRSLEMQIE